MAVIERAVLKINNSLYQFMKKALQEIFNFSASITLTLIVLTSMALLLALPLAEKGLPESLKTSQLISILSSVAFYQSKMFVVLLVLFCTNLLACMVKHLMNTFRFIKNLSQQPDDFMLSTLPVTDTIMLMNDAALKERLSSALTGCFKRPTIIYEDMKCLYLYAERHRFAHLGFYLAHLSMFTLILGIIGSNNGFNYPVYIAKGQVIDPLTVQDDDGNLKTFNFGLRCRDFSVEYYADGNGIKKIDCTVDILKNGQTIKTQQIDSAHALQYAGIDVLQNKMIDVKQQAQITVTAGDGITHSYGVFTGDTFTLPGTATRIRAASFETNRLQLNCFLPPARLWISHVDAHFSEQSLEDFSFKLSGFIYTKTVILKIIDEPGREVIWASCACLIVGFFIMLFFSHQKVWIKVETCSDGCRVTFAGAANKNIHLLHGICVRFKEAAGEMLKLDTTKRPER